MTSSKAAAGGAATSIRVLLVDDHRMMREGLRAVLEGDGRIDVVGEADDGRTALEMVRELAPDVVVMDISMPGMNGIEAVHRIRAEHPAARVIALSMYCDRSHVLGMLESGACGYVPKISACEELVRAITSTSTGKTYLSPEIAGVVVDSYVQRLLHAEGAAGDVLGSKEREVLQLLAEGKSSKEIAAVLRISAKTVDAHRRNIMKKLDLHTIAELTKYAVRAGLTSLER